MKVILSNTQIKELANNYGANEINLRSMAARRDPTERQKAAGNYQMGHVVVEGMPITIENPIGSKRTFVRPNGSQGYVVMQNHYGYFSRTEGKDGDAVDVFLGPLTRGFSKVYVVDQYINGEFDESKVMLGFASLGQAKAAYFANYDKHWKGFKAITGVPIEIFKEWLYRGRKQTKEFRSYAIIQKNKVLNEEKK